jgi:hypothetical protein
VLRASRKLLRAGGRLAFFTISIPAGLSDTDRRRAVAAGPPTPDGPRLSQMLGRAGFVHIREVDCTADFLTTARAWLAARLRHRETVRPLDPEMYDGRLAQGRASIAAIEDGLLRRNLYVAAGP